MKKRVLMSLLLTFLLFALSGESNLYAKELSKNLYFAEYPSLSPDGQDIYFSYEGDIFKVGAKGGLALRFLNLSGNESYPLVSPDGKWLAFSSTVQGNNDVYVVPISGGDAIRLTFHQANDVPAAWSPDSKSIYFESNRENTVSVYQVALTGGTPVRLFENYFNTIINFALNPATGEYYFNESTESINFPTRKGYKGDHNPNIKGWNPATRTYKEYTDYIGKDTWPMVDKNGQLYYVTDSENKESNIAKYVPGGKPQMLTHFKQSVQFPSISYGGDAMVFLLDYKIQYMDLRTGKTSEPIISVAGGPVESLSSFKEQVPTAFAASSDGKKIALGIRGLLYVSDPKGKYLKLLDTPQDERVTDVLWANDNNTIYYLRTNKGITNVYTIKADGSEAEKLLYGSKDACNSLTLSHKGDKLVFICGNKDVMLHQNGKTTSIAKAEFWSFRAPSINFSFDDNYIAFTAMNLFESDIYLYNFAQKQLTNLTHSASSEGTAVFSPDGKYLYFAADLTSSTFPSGGGKRSLYKLPLQRYDSPFTSDVYDNLFSEPKKAKDSTVVIDFKDIYKRLQMETSQFGYFDPFTWQNGKKAYLIYSATFEGSIKTLSLDLSDPDAKPKPFKDIVLGSFFPAGKDLYASTIRGAYYKVDPAAATATKLTLTTSITKDLTNEFTQMFYETWGALDQNFYDVNFHGIDWEAKRDYYASFLPYVKSRAQLRLVLRDLLGELNSSHLGFSSSGEEEKVAVPFTTLSYETGVVFANEHPYVLDYVLEQSPAHKIELDLQKGDRLVAVNGKRVDPKENRNKYFTSAVKWSEVTLTWDRGGKEFVTKIHTIPYSTMRTLFYTQWEENCRQKVDEMGKGRIAYTHMRDMVAGSLTTFLQDMHTDACNKDALILDLRFNNGGNVHQQVIDFLQQEEHFRWSHRDFPKSTHPNITPANKPLVVLVNEHSLSDAEVTANGIKTLKIATIVGTETYRWIIFTSSFGLIDGSSCRIPGWGCYNLQGTDLESIGVAPDIYVKNTFDDRMNGRDPQLDRAIEEILKQL